MARSPKTSLSEDARKRIDGARVARLATSSRRGEPHVVPLCFARSGRRIYFVVDEKPKRTRTGLRRLRNIAENPRVAFLVDFYDEDWDRLAYVLVRGRAAPVREAREWRRAVALLRRRYPQYRRMPLEFSRNPVVRIEVEKVHTWSAGGPKTGEAPRARARARRGEKESLPRSRRRRTAKTVEPKPP
ncbi:MAG: hypothetical protein KatS3mg076_0834 [Candidatus Binatia bacterium]|nr:MAG: hypothetical protein KatS3mg076_0834 [Candidatus Binatia bacterium]